MRGRIQALLLLAWALIRTLWRRAFNKAEPGLAIFRANYAADGLTALSAADRLAMREFGRCIACGRCNRGDGPLMLASEGRFKGTMGLVLAAARSMPEYRAAAEGFALLDDAALERKERLCPTQVPLRRLAAFVRSNAAAAKVSLPAAQGTKTLPSSFPPRSEHPRSVPPSTR